VQYSDDLVVTLFSFAMALFLFLCGVACGLLLHLAF